MSRSTKTFVPSIAPLTWHTRIKWLSVTAHSIADKFKAKYAKGMEEKKSDLGEVTTYDLLEEMEQEALDQLAYVRELKRRFNLPTDQL